MADHLTQRDIADLEPVDGKQFVQWDHTLAGFGVRVSPGGAKTFVCKYRLHTGRVRWATIGRTNVLSLVVARKRAQDMLGAVAKGDDPLRTKDAARGAVTVADAAKRFMVEHVQLRRKPKTVQQYGYMINAQITPRLGTLAITEVSTDDVVQLHHRLRATPIWANGVVRVLSKLLAWSVTVKLRPAGSNPCAGVEPYPERKRKRYLSDDEYAQIGQGLRTEAISQPSARTVIELLLLTGARPIEIVSLEWAFVDLERAALNLPDSKTGEKVIGLPPAAVRLLTKWPRFATSPYIFPALRGKIGHLSTSTLRRAWHQMRAAAALVDCRLYDACRHSYASIGISKHKLSLVQLGEQLGHKRVQTTSRYAHLHDEQKRRQVKAVGGSIAAALKRKVR